MTSDCAAYCIARIYIIVYGQRYIQRLGFTFLFITEATTDQMLSLLFKQFPGFQRVRTDSEKPGLASVQFRCAAEATTALSGLQGFRLNATHTMEIEYAKSAI